MELRTVEEWARVWAVERGQDPDVVAAAARRHLEDLAELEGHPRGEIETWRLTAAAARTLLDGLEVSRRRGESGSRG